MSLDLTDCVADLDVFLRLSTPTRIRFDQAKQKLLDRVRAYNQAEIIRKHCDSTIMHKQTFMIIFPIPSGDPAIALYGSWESAAHVWGLQGTLTLATDFEAARSSPTPCTIYGKSKQRSGLPPPTMTKMPCGFRRTSRQLLSYLKTGKLTLDDLINWNPELDTEK